MGSKVKRFGFWGNVIFFLDVFVALMIILGAWRLVQTDFGKAAMAFGFVMVAITTMLKVVQRW